jgi:hypothetical protein
VTEDDVSWRRTAFAPRRYHREIVNLRLNAAGWLRAHAVVLAAIALVCVQVWWTVAVLAHSYFRQDDYLILDRARLQELSWPYLMSLDPGDHVSAGGLAIPLAGPLYRWPWTERLSYSGPAIPAAPVPG